MKSTKLSVLGASIALALAAAAPALHAQDNATPPGQEGRRNPEEFRRQMEERMKAGLKASDDEWKVLSPMIEKVFTARMAEGGGRFGGGRGPGGPPGGAGGGTAAPASAGAPAPAGGERGRGGSPEQQALREALDNESSTPEEIKAKLTAVREARKKSEADLTAAREALRKVVTVRQEAYLVSRGILD